MKFLCVAVIFACVVAGVFSQMKKPCLRPSKPSIYSYTTVYKYFFIDHKWLGPIIFYWSQSQKNEGMPDNYESIF